MIALAAVWIIPLLFIGGWALDRVLTRAITANFDEQLNYAVTALIASAEIGPAGEARSRRPLNDQRFDEPYSGLYWQVSEVGKEPFRSRSLWDRALTPDLVANCRTPCLYRSERFTDEPLRVVERDAVLPGSKVVLHFQVAQSTRDLDLQIGALRRTLLWSLSALGLGLLALAALQSTYGLWPLRKVSRAIAAIRSGGATHVPNDFPPEIAPLVGELNELLEHNAAQAEAARLHAGNLAHALKTPMSVLIGAAREAGCDLAGDGAPADRDHAASGRSPAGPRPRRRAAHRQRLAGRSMAEPRGAAAHAIAHPCRAGRRHRPCRAA